MMMVVYSEELTAVIVEIGHVLHVAKETHGGVFIGVRVEGGVPEHLMQFGGGRGAVLVVFAEDREGFRLEGGGRVFEVLEAV
jgi:hypothetical protein